MFLKRLYHQWRPMFWVVIIFIICQVLFMYKAVETIPFFLFNMYSTRQQPLDTTYRTTIYINGKYFNTDNISGHERETLLGSLAYFRKLKDHGFYATDSQTIKNRFSGKVPSALYNTFYKRLTNTSVTDKLFYNWWCKYLSRVARREADSFTIIQSGVIWNPSYHALKDTVSSFSYVREN
jgi:hypothetical protein